MCTCTILEGLQTCRLGRLFFSRAVVGRLRLNAPSISTTQNWRANPKTANLPKSYLQYRLSYQHMHESSMKKIKRYSTTPSFGPFPGLPWLCYFHCPVLEECPISHNKFHFPLPVKFPTSLWTQVQMETGCKATWSGFCHWVLLWLAKWLLQRQYPKVETAYPYRAKVKTQNWRLFWRFNANIYFFV